LFAYKNKVGKLLTNYLLIQNWSAEERILRRMPFLMQPSPFPIFGLTPPMATVEAGVGSSSAAYPLNTGRVATHSDIAPRL
jgi:hypothetical protein